MKRMLSRRALVAVIKGGYPAGFEITNWPKDDTLIPHSIWARLVARSRKLPFDSVAAEAQRRIEFLRRETLRVDWNQAVTEAYARIRVEQPDLAEEDVEAIAFALGHGAIVALEPGRTGPEIPGVTYERWGAIDESDEDGG